MEKISIDEFAKLDLRVGEIIEVALHPKADKLFVLKVDLNEGNMRTIVAGLREYYEVEELVGKKAIFVANLKPVMLRGVESNGMILAAVSSDKKEVVVLKPEKEIGNGTKIS